MARPVKYRKVCRMPLCRKFYGGEMCESVIALTVEEYETLRLIDYQGLSQEACARQMEASRATIQALYAEARKKRPGFWWKAPLSLLKAVIMKYARVKAVVIC